MRAENLIAYGDGTPESGMVAMNDLLRARPRPTAVFCYNDRLALGAMRAIHDHGLRIPKDISVIGIDDLFFAPYTDPPLTTVSQPTREMGQRAAALLFSLLGGSKARNVVTKGKLRVRRSTARAKV